MDQTKKLEVEILSGPLDGHTITLENDTEWTRSVGSLLSFPWDEELGEPQARFVISEEGWQLESAKTKRGTHLLRPNTEDRLPAILQIDDVLKASNTWLRVKAIEE